MTSSSPFPPSAAGRPSQPPEPAEPAFEPPVIQPVRPTPPKRSNMGGYLLTLAAVIAVGGLAFAVGRVTAPAAAAAIRTANGFGQGTFGQGGTAGANGSFVPGQNGAADGGFARRALATEATVTAVAADHLTIEIGTSGQTIDVKTDAGTTYHTQQAASASAVTAGSKVLLQFNAATAGAAGGAAPSGGSAAPSGAPGVGGFLRAFGTVKDVTVLAQ